jgi:D-methionine transport system substrate-binding protein
MKTSSWAKLLAVLGLALAAPSLAGAETIRVGVSAGPHAQLMEAVGKEAVKDGLEIKIVEFTDYVIPNAALAQGEIEANSFQHQPYLDGQ